MHTPRTLSLSAAALVLAAGSATAQFTDGFETYSLGQLDGQGGWHGWDGNNTIFANVVNTQNHTTGGSQSAELAAGADSVHEFTTFTSGAWSVTGWAFFPTGFTGKTYFILMNDYQDLGPYQWGAQMGFNGDSGRMECDCGSSTPVERALVTNAWVDFRYDIDLDNDIVDVYYNTGSNPNPIATYDWSGGVFGSDNFATLAIEAVDLYPDAVSTAPSPMFFDDIAIEPAGPPPAGTAYCFGDGSGTSCPCGNPGGAGRGCANGVNPAGGQMEAEGSSSLSAGDLVFTGNGLQPGQPGLYFQGDNATNAGQGAVFGDGLRCAGGNVVRLQTVSADVAGDSATTVDIGVEGGVAPGDTKRYQLWYRNPMNSLCGTNFNLTNGFEVVWAP